MDGGVEGGSKMAANQTRQLEVAAFPTGLALGAIGALLWPVLFPNKTTTTTTTTTTKAPLAPIAGAVGAAIGATSAADLGILRTAVWNLLTIKLTFNS